MAGAADPMMLFPTGTTFTPYSIARNVSDSPLTITPTVWWMEGAAGPLRSASANQLAAYETRSLDVTSLLSQAHLLSETRTFNGSFNLVFRRQLETGGPAHEFWQRRPDEHIMFLR